MRFGPQRRCPPVSEPIAHEWVGSGAAQGEAVDVLDPPTRRPTGEQPLAHCHSALCARDRWQSLSGRDPAVDLPPPRAWRVVVVTLKNRTLSPVVDEFITHLRDYVNSAEAGLKRAKQLA